MTKQSLVSDELWDAIGPLPPREPPKPRGGAGGNPRPATLGLRRVYLQERFDRLPEVVRYEGFVLHGAEDATPGRY